VNTATTPDLCLAPADVTGLLARWRATGARFVVLDECGRHRDLAAGRLDLTRAAACDVRWIEATLHRAGYAVLDAGNVPREARARVLRRADAGVRRLRAETGQPEWVLVDGAGDGPARIVVRP
jgi:hypothetical protein